MTNEELKAVLGPVTVLFLGYLVLPLIAQAVLGGHDALFGSIAVSDLLQAGLAAVLLKKLFALKELLAAELKGRLGRRGQPQERTLELSGRIVSSAGYVITAGLLLPPLGGMLPGSRLITLAKVCAVGYALYAAYGIWKLSEPFLAFAPPDAPDAGEEAPPAAPLGRCPKCGQLIDASMKACAFCGHPVKPGA